MKNFQCLESLCGSFDESAAANWIDPPKLMMADSQPSLYRLFDVSTRTLRVTMVAISSSNALKYNIVTSGTARRDIGHSASAHHRRVAAENFATDREYPQW